MPAMEVQLAQGGWLTNNPVNYIWNVGAPMTDKWKQLLALKLIPQRHKKYALTQ